jgi:hypothetical protein
MISNKELIFAAVVAYLAAAFAITGIALGSVALYQIASLHNEVMEPVTSKLPVLFNPFLLQQQWWISPSFGNDANTGLTAQTPIRTFLQLIARWGGTASPMLPLSVNITFMDDQLTFADPVALSPIMGHDASLTFTGVASVVATGTFTAITARNRATGQRWVVQDTSKPANYWTQYVGYLVLDTTEDALFWIDADLGNSSFLASEPIGSASINNPNPPLATITVGDHYNLIKPGPKVQLVDYSPYNGEGITSTLSFIWVITPQREETWRVQTFTFLNAIRSDGMVQLSPYSSNGGLVSTNSWYGPGLSIGDGCSLVAGSTGALSGGTNVLSVAAGANNVIFDGDFVVDASIISNIQGGLTIGTLYWGPSTFEAPNLNPLGVGTSLISFTDNAFYLVCALWGPSVLNVHVGGVVQYTPPATACFQQLGGMTLEGSSTAIAMNTTGAHATFNTGVSLTPTKLDASVASGGFNGLALGTSGLTRIVAVV